MLKYTICFIKQGNNILLLNRNFPTWMGIWNGVGGKIEEDETPTQSIIREIKEETGLTLDSVVPKGTVTWTVDSNHDGGMYLFYAELATEYQYNTPIKTEEGILDWKEIAWILNPDNLGIATNVPKFLPFLLRSDKLYEHKCVFEHGMLTEFVSINLTQEHQNDLQVLQSGVKA